MIYTTYKDADDGEMVSSCFVRITGVVVIQLCILKHDTHDTTMTYTIELGSTTFCQVKYRP